MKRIKKVALGVSIISIGALYVIAGKLFQKKKIEPEKNIVYNKFGHPELI